MEENLCELYQFVFEACADAVFVYEIDEMDVLGNFIEVNDAACKLLGYSKRELLAKSVYDLADTDSATMSLQYKRHLIEYGTLYSDWIQVSKSGEHIPVKIHARMLTFRNKRLVVSVSRDLRSPKKMERVLEQNNRLEASLTDVTGLLNTLVDVVPVAVYTFDAENRITSWNKSAEDMFGWRADEVLGKNNPTVGEKEPNFHELLMRGQRVEGVDCTRKRKDGSFVSVSIWGASLCSDEGKPIGAIGIAIDRTEQKQMQRKLSESEKRMDDVLHSIDLFVWSLDLELNKLTFCSGGLEKICGLNAEELLQDTQNVVRLIYPDDMQIFLDSMVQIRAGEPFQSEHRIVTRRGDVRWVRSHGKPWRDSDGMIRSMDAVTIDITDRKLSELESQERQNRYESLLNLIPDAVIVHREAVIRYANDASQRMLGLDSSPVGRCVWDFFPEDRRQILSARFGMGDDYIGSVIPKIKHQLLRSDGTEFPVETSSVVIQDEGEPSILTVTKDISHQVQTENDLLFIANHDPLTGLPNRRFLGEQLDHLTRQSNTEFRDDRHAILFIDMDGFKKINDSFGHEFGDNTLKKMTDRLKECLPDNVLLSRFGGDEFAILFPFVSNKEQLELLAERIRCQFIDALVVEDKEFFITPSIGLAMYPMHGTDSETLLKHADIAMYRAKSMGGNRSEFYTKEDENILKERIVLETDLKKALEREEFFIEYQPKFRLDTGELYGLEALVRWKHPARGIIPPAKFIPLAEECGVIAPLGEWVLREACRQNRRWQMEGHKPLIMSVNVSPKQFQVRNMVTVLQTVLQETQLNPSWLDIEITEGLLVHNSKEIASVLKTIRAMGAEVSIDDFGTGYSSLAYLQKFEPTHLKIDQSFVASMLSDSGSMCIVNAVIGLAHSLGMQVIAEGVETDEQLTYLRTQGCEIAQGYVFSKPVDSKTIEMDFLLQRA